MYIDYSALKASDLNEIQINECSRLYCENYGNYSDESIDRSGKPVMMSPSYYQKNYMKAHFYVAMAHSEGKLVAHAFYIRKTTKKGVITWVVQLVVSRNYRKQGIASTLLRSIWGFSNDYAWGLATANPCTVRTLESATFRICDPEMIYVNFPSIQEMGDDISFVEDSAYEVTEFKSQLNSRFFVDNSDYDGIEEYEKRLGKLEPGREWLAFVFYDQKIDSDLFRRHFDEMIAFSEAKLIEAYSRMQMDEHGWTRGTDNEVSVIRSFLNENQIKIVDMGCGSGRHSVALGEFGYEVTGFDFSEKHIEKAGRYEVNGNCSFVFGDVRSCGETGQYDAALCLYDVIGSFPEEENNIAIIQNVRRVLKPKGLFFLSVMNMELTEELVPEMQKGDLRQNPDILFDLTAADIMQSNGEVFQPEHLAIDINDGLVYRKEQFHGDEMLSAEYVIRDKRFRMDEIKQLLENEGFDIVEARYVSAGHFDRNLLAVDPHAKEIFVVCRRR